MMRTKSQIIKGGLLAAFLVLSSVCMQAQVTVGSSEKPQKFSVLEIISTTDRVGGLRLPQLTNMEKQTLRDSKAFKDEEKGKARGLMIFNTEDKCLEIWDGTNWIRIKHSS